MSDHAGVSIIICCHNSQKNIMATLEHLQQQCLSDEVPWEVLVVNNASTDDTLKIIENVWAKAPVTTLRIVNENRLGLVNARMKGFAEAYYDFVSFVDDDNHVAPDWVARVYKFFLADEKIAALGGFNEPVFEEEEPWWFQQFHRSYAVGVQGDHPGDITTTRGVLFGAGLSVRKKYWEFLQHNGFEFNLVGRQGRRLLCGEDYELCLALRLAGGKIWYSPELRLKHFLPRQRLTWKYLRGMIGSVGYTDLVLESYYAAYSGNSLPPWHIELIQTVKAIARQPIKLVRYLMGGDEGDPTILAMDRCVGRLKSICLLRGHYNKIFNDIKSAGWNVRKTYES